MLQTGAGPAKMKELTVTLFGAALICCSVLFWSGLQRSGRSFLGPAALDFGSSEIENQE